MYVGLVCEYIEGFFVGFEVYCVVVFCVEESEYFVVDGENEVSILFDVFGDCGKRVVEGLEVLVCV